MFTKQITIIESEIQALIDKKNQYCTLEKQVESVKEALNQIEQTAHELDPETMPQVLTALGLPMATVTTITEAQVPQQAQQLEQLQQQSHKLEQVKEESQQAQAQVTAQQEEITSLRQKLLAAERKAQASKEQQEATERHVISEKEMLEEQKIAYVEHMQDLENTAAQFVFPSDIENFIRSGQFEFDLESDLIEVVEYLDKTPDWCLKARVEYLRSTACTLVREHLSQHLSARLLIHWKEYIVAETQTVNQPANQLKTITSSEDFEPDYQKLFQLQSGQYLQPHEKPVSENGQQPSKWVNLVEDDDFPDEYEEEEKGEVENEGEYQLGVTEDENDEDCWGQEGIKAENNEWNKPTVKADNTQPELKFGDRVRIQSGEICTIENTESVGIVTYFTLKFPNGKTQSGFRACDFQRIGTQEPVVEDLEELEELEEQAPEATNKPAEVVSSSSVPAVESQAPEAATSEVVQNQVTKTEAVPKVGSWVKVPDGRNGQVLYFTTTLDGEENVAVEVTPLKGKRKKVEQFPINQVTVIIAEVTDPPIAKDKYIDRECESPDGRTGRVIKTRKKGRFVELTVSFEDGTKQEYDLNCLWFLPPQKADSQAA